MHDCSTCGSLLADEWKLNRHMRTHMRVPVALDCDICGKVCQTPSKLKRHRHAHEVESTRAKRPRIACDVCGEVCQTATQLKKHRDVHIELLNCDLCGKQYRDAAKLQQHRSTHKPRIACDVCGKVCQTHPKLERHMVAHEVLQTLAETSCAEERIDETINVVASGGIEAVSEYDEDIRGEVAANWSVIMDWEETGRPLKDCYNIRTVGYDINTVERKLTEIYNNSGCVFKARIMGGFILQRRVPDDDDDTEPIMRYFYPSRNSTVLEETVTIGDHDELVQVIEELRSTDIKEKMEQTRYVL